MAFPLDTLLDLFKSVHSSGGDDETIRVSGTVTSTPPTPSTAPGLSTSRTVALSNTATAVKASAGNVFGYHIQNPNNSDAYLQFYDASTGSVVVGTTTPKVTIWVPANGAIDGPTSTEYAIAYATAITIAATTTITGGTAPSTGLLANIYYS